MGLLWGCSGAAWGCLGLPGAAWGCLGLPGAAWACSGAALGRLINDLTISKPFVGQVFGTTLRWFCERG